MLQDHRPTLFFAGPTYYAALLNADLPADAFTSVRECVSAGEAFPASLFERFTSHFGVEMLDGIGSTEMLHLFISGRPGRTRIRIVCEPAGTSSYQTLDSTLPDDEQSTSDPICSSASELAL